MNKKLKAVMVRAGPSLLFLLAVTAWWLNPSAEHKPDAPIQLKPGEIAYQQAFHALNTDIKMLGDPGQAEAFEKDWQNRFTNTGDLDTPEGTKKAIEQLKKVGSLQGCPEKFDGRCLFIRAQRAYLRYHYNLGENGTPNLADPKQRVAWIALVNSKIDPKLFETEAGTDAAIRQMRDMLGKPFDYVNGPAKTRSETAQRDAQFGGIGVPVGLLDAPLNDQFRLFFGPPAEGSPLYGKVGRGDLLVSINDQPINGLTMKEANRRMTGNPGDRIKLKVLRGKALQPFEAEAILACNVEQQQCQGEANIGVTMGLTHVDELMITADSPLVAHKPSEKSPALGKIEEGDEISKVDGIDLIGMKLTAATDKIRGPADTPVVLTVRRKNKDGQVETIDVTVMRESIVTHAAHFTALPGDIGLVELDQFESLTVPGDVAAMVARTVLPLSIKALAGKTDADSLAWVARFEQLKKNLDAGAQLDGTSLRVAMKAREVYDEFGEGGGFILDLSHNPGGELGVFEDVAGILLPDGLVLSKQAREWGTDQIIVHDETLLPSAFLLSDHPLGNGIEKTTTQLKPRVPLLLPKKMSFVVLIGPPTASAAELTAGMLKAHKRAILIGQTLPGSQEEVAESLQEELLSSSLGKGSGQALINLPYGYSLHVTRFEFFPGGLKSNGRGVIADIDAAPSAQRAAAVAEIGKMNLAGAANQAAVLAAIERNKKLIDDLLRDRNAEDLKDLPNQNPEIFH